MTSEITINLQDKIDELQAELRELRDVIGKHEAMADDPPADDKSAQEILEDIYEGTSYETEVDFSDLGDDRDREFYLNLDYDQLKKAEKEFVNKRETITAKIDEWGSEDVDGGAFTIQEFTAGQKFQRDDLVMGDANQRQARSFDEVTNAGKLRTVQIGVKKKPPAAPDHPKEYPPVITDFLYQKINNLNTYGEVDVGHFSAWGTSSDDSSPSI